LSEKQKFDFVQHRKTRLYFSDIITTNWIIQTLQFVSELTTIPAMLCVPIFLIYGIIKLIKERKNRNYLLICIVNFVSLVLIIGGFIFYK